MSHVASKGMHRSMFGKFRQVLSYKCEWYGKKLIAVDPKNTSRICSKCGYNSGAKPLEIREWTCSKCQTKHDRDINAAVNILHKGSTKLNGQGLAMVTS